MPLLSVVLRSQVALALLCAMPAVARAQPRPPQTSTPAVPPRDRLPAATVGTGALKGRVVDSATEQPVARARVMLQGGGGPRPPVMTDDSGGFSFTRLPAGGYSLQVQKSTYMPQMYPEGGRTIRSMRQPLTVTDSATVDNIVVKLFHGGAITGRILDAHGDPVESASVQALRVPPSGAGRIAMRAVTSSNDLGEFRLARLEPGAYVLFANAQRGGEVFINGRPVEEAQPVPIPTYYPSAPSLTQAQAIPVGRGQTASGIDIMLGEGLAATVTGTVVSRSGQAITSNANVSFRAIATEIPGGFGFGGMGTSVRADGTFRQQLPPGDYQIEARLQPQNSNQGRPDPEQFGSVRMTLAEGANEAVSIVIGPGATASGRIVFEGSTAQPPVPSQPIYVPFSSPEPGSCRSGQAQVSSDWTFRIEGLRGTCTAPPMSMFGRWTLKALQSGGQDLLERAMTFEPGQDLRNLQLVFSDRRTEVNFHVVDEHGAPTREYVAIVFAADKAKWSQVPRYVRWYAPTVVNTTGKAATPVGTVLDSSSQPREVISGLPAGDYFVLAVDDIETEGARDPAVLEALAMRAIRIEVSDAAPVEVPLQRLKLADVLPRKIP